MKTRPGLFLSIFSIAALATAACHHTPVNSELQPPVTLAMAQRGDTLFHNHACVKCHGDDAKGRKNGPNLTGPTFLHVNGTYSDFVRLITSGVPKDSIKVKTHQFDMQPRGGSRNPLTDDEIRAVAGYVYSLSHPLKG